MDIVALQDTRLQGAGRVKERGRKLPDDIREHEVGFAVKNTLLGSIIPPTEGSERIMSLQLYYSVDPVSLISA